MRKSKLRIRGNARFFMMLARDMRRRWMQYGENRLGLGDRCFHCSKMTDIQADHIEPLGKYPRSAEEIGPYVTKLLYGACRPLCGPCNKARNKK